LHDGTKPCISFPADSLRAVLSSPWRTRPRLARRCGRAEAPRQLTFSERKALRLRLLSQTTSGACRPARRAPLRPSRAPMRSATAPILPALVAGFFAQLPTRPEHVHPGLRGRGAHARPPLTTFARAANTPSWRRGHFPHPGGATASPSADRISPRRPRSRLSGRSPLPLKFCAPRSFRCHCGGYIRAGAPGRELGDFVVNVWCTYATTDSHPSVLYKKAVCAQEKHKSVSCVVWQKV